MSQYEGIPYYPLMCSAILNGLYSGIESDILHYAMSRSTNAVGLDQNISCAIDAKKFIDQIKHQRKT